MKQSLIPVHQLLIKILFLFHSDGRLRGYKWYVSAKQLLLCELPEMCLDYSNTCAAVYFQFSAFRDWHTYLYDVWYINYICNYFIFSD